MPRTGRLAPPVLLMGVIFALSAVPSLSSGLGTADFFLRKAAHMTEYGLLWFLWRRALTGTPLGRGIAAALIAISYAATDEYHQTFVSGRHGSPVDVGIDSVGVAIAAAIRAGLRARSRRLRAARA